MSKVILITGASKGFGFALTQNALARGHNVVATSRDTHPLQDLVKNHSNQMLSLKLDVTNRKEVQQAIEKAADRFGQIDVLINNAGYGAMGAIEEFSEAEVRRQFETNVFGALWMMQEILPYMRAKRSGFIINMSSIAGHVVYEGSGLYAASKMALQGLGEGIRSEAGKYGIQVTSVAPGPFRTDFAGASMMIAQKQIEDYQDVHARLSQYQNKISGNQPGDPEKAANAILDLLDMKAPPLTLPLGNLAYTAIPERLNSTMKEIEQFESLGRSTDFAVENA